jgi:hypothetical protein
MNPNFIAPDRGVFTPRNPHAQSFGVPTKLGCCDRDS